jgi:hypothetical protein
MPACMHVVRLKEDVWLGKLDSEQVKSVENFLASSGCMHALMRHSTVS